MNVTVPWCFQGNYENASKMDRYFIFSQVLASSLGVSIGSSIETVGAEHLS
ncbi:MAG: hypothetical protein MUO26_08375 [Methanotrichaceae archaeon]|nr:hypothetical protein [Methanotrichaceae archaeon]